MSEGIKDTVNQTNLCVIIILEGAHKETGTEAYLKN